MGNTWRLGACSLFAIGISCASHAALAADKECAVDLNRPYLERQWRLGTQDDCTVTDLQPHRPTYLLPYRRTNSVNRQANSPAPGHLGAYQPNYRSDEFKFQLSFKADASDEHRTWGFMNDWFGLDAWRVWFGYTQQSNWQLRDKLDSSPFRDTNYEPEFILSLAKGSLNSRNFKLLNLGLAHQSNGQPDPTSRSWNRVYLQGGWEFDKVSVLVRRWWRVLDSGPEDDNPDIMDYVGRGDVLLRWGNGGNTLSLLLRNNLRGTNNRTFGQLDMAFPWFFRGEGVRFHIQVTSGYGESLLDYNYRQQTLGFGVSFGRW